MMLVVEKGRKATTKSDCCEGLNSDEVMEIWRMDDVYALHVFYTFQKCACLAQIPGHFADDDDDDIPV